MRKQTLTLSDRFFQFIKRGLEQAQAMSPGKDRDHALQKVRQAEVALQIDEWLKLSAADPKVKAPSADLLV
jgi:hypothetical protein